MAIFKYLTQNVTTGLDLVPLSVGATSNSFSMDGLNNLILVTFNHVANSSGALTLNWYLDQSFDGGTTWHRYQSQTVAGAIITNYDAQYRKAISGSLEKWFTIVSDIGPGLCRIVVPAVAGAAATDTLTVGAYTAVV